MKQEHLIELVTALVGSIVLGYLVKWLVFPILYRITTRTKWKSDDLIIESISKWVVFWFFLGACVYVFPLGVEYLPFVRRNESIFRQIIGSLYIFSLTWMVGRIVGGMLQIRSKRDGSEIPSTSILANIARAVVYCVGFILILQNFGVAIGPLLTALGVGGLAVALALQPTLSNLFSGLQIIASGKVNIGDFVQLEGGQKGFVRDITWRNTTIETGQNNVIIVPNSKMADSIVENYYLADRKVIFSVAVGVAYDSDLEKVERVAIEVGKEVLNRLPGGNKDFEPLVRFYQFGPSSIDLKVHLQVQEYADQFLIVSEFIKALRKRFTMEGIEIPFPVRTIIQKQ